MIEIKRLTRDRWRDYQQLRLEALKMDSIAFGSSYEEEILFSQELWQNRIGDVLFAVANDKPIGMVVCVCSNKLKTKHVANIYGMYVSREYRNQGIGSLLIERAISQIKENKAIRKINLSVNPAQKFAVKLYNKHGFKSAGLFKDAMLVDGQFYDEIPMEKFI